MVARTALDTIIALGWVGALACVLLARALFSWLSFRQATKSEREARRLAEATRSVAREAAERRDIATPIPLHSRSPKSPAARAEG
jgi:hypothetical protein